MSPSQPRPATGDTKIIVKDDKATRLPAKQIINKRRRWILAAGLGLLLLLLIAGLGIGLPLGLRKKQQNAVGLSSSGARQLKGTTRSYYLAADSIDWDYAPSGRDLCHNKEFTGAAELYTLQGIGTKYKKAVYKRYTDSSFQVI
jgi:hephaestin